MYFFIKILMLEGSMSDIAKQFRAFVSCENTTEYRKVKKRKRHLYL